MTIEEAIKNREHCLRYLEGCGPRANPENMEAVRLSLVALREKAEREKNEPLTLDELQKMDEAPVYVVDTVNGSDSQWCIVSVSEHFPGQGAAYPGGYDCFWFDFKDYGKKWLAYRRKPEEG